MILKKKNKIKRVKYATSFYLKDKKIIKSYYVIQRAKHAFLFSFLNKILWRKKKKEKKKKKKKKKREVGFGLQS